MGLVLGVGLPWTPTLPGVLILSCGPYCLPWDFASACVCVGVSLGVPTGVHPQSLDWRPLRAGQVPLLSVPSAGLAFNPAVSGALLTARDLPREPSDSPGAVGASVLKLSVSRPRCSAAHLPDSQSPPPAPRPCGILGRPPAQAPGTGAPGHGGVFGPERCVIPELPRHLHQQLQMTLQELNYNVSVLAESRNR